MLYDLIILGGGPAGVSAGIYAARKKLKTMLIAPEIGGQSIVSEEIQNWIGTPSIKGEELARQLKEHLLSYADDSLETTIGAKALKVEKKNDTDGFLVIADKGAFETRGVLVATGSHRRKLEIPGAEQFNNKGISYCASCDGPLFAGKDVAVVGGGNAGFETAAQLLAYAKSVTLFHRGEEFSKADPITVEKVLKNPKMKALTNTEPTAIKGGQFISAVVYKNKKTGEEKELPIGGLFVEIGAVPTTDFVKDIVDVNEFGAIKIDPWTQQTSDKGIWAAGDCTNVLYHQNNISAGDGVRAIEDIYLHLHGK
ncbi:MAG: FAD-dependent oxidoreductase [Parcubacteria group bacterium]|nr:FAD-dependent oxidoreductase [Parcubacteria group bacterium]